MTVTVSQLNPTQKTKASHQKQVTINETDLWCEGMIQILLH